MKVGLRLEYTDQTLNIANPDYFSIFDRETLPTYEINQLDWFPTLHINYLLSDISELTLAGSWRISRPPTKNMAPFLYRRHYEVYVVGDPALQPEYTNLVELSLGQDPGKQEVILRQGPIAEITLANAFNSKDKTRKKAESTFGNEQF